MVKIVKIVSMLPAIHTNIYLIAALSPLSQKINIIYNGNLEHTFEISQDQLEFGVYSSQDFSDTECSKFSENHVSFKQILLCRKTFRSDENVAVS